jgi:CheY-like chemotaxis protein
MNQALCILYVEDDENDVFFMQRALDQAGVTNPFRVVNDGQTAIDYLAGAAAFADRIQFPVPSLVLLDLKLPRKSGLQVLAWVRQQPALLGVVIIVLSSSSQAGDIEQAYALGANAYVLKPPSEQARTDLVRAIKAFWLTFNEKAGQH